MRKRLIAVTLALCLAMTLAAPAWAAEEKIITPRVMNTTMDDITWEYDTLSGERITNTTFQGKIQVLVYFKVSGICSNSNSTIRQLATCDWIKRDDVQVIAIAGSGRDSSGNMVMPSMETVQAYADTYALGCDDILFAWADDGYVSSAFDYLKKAHIIADDASSVTLAVNVILDGENRIRAAWMGGYQRNQYTDTLNQIDNNMEPEKFGLYQFSISGLCDYDEAYDVLEKLNEHRRNNGLNELVMDEELLDAGMQRAAEIAVYYSHTRPNQTDCFTVNRKVSGENIAVGYSDAQDVMTAWKNSPGHNANMLKNGRKSVGIGCFVHGGKKCWVQLFSSSEGIPETTISQGSQAEKHEIIANSSVLKIQVNPISAVIRVGNSKNFCIESINKGFPYFYSLLTPSFAAVEDTEVATVELTETGAVVTAVGGGNTVLKLGMQSAEAGKPPLTVDIPIEVTAIPLTKSMFTVDTNNIAYTGSALEKQISGQDEGKALILGKDYTVSYADNINAGTASLTIQGKGAYSGELTYSFTIDKAEQAALEIESRSAKFGEELILNTTGGSGDGEVSYTIVDGAEIASIRSGKLIPKDVGTVTVKATKAESANYKEAFATQEIEIGKGTVPDTFEKAASTACSYQAQKGTYSLANLLVGLDLGDDPRLTARIKEAGGILQADGVHMAENGVLEYLLEENLEKPTEENVPSASVIVEVESAHYENFQLEIEVRLSAKEVQIAPAAADFDLILAPDGENNTYIATIRSELENLEYSFDGGKTWGSIREKADLTPGETVNATIRYQETEDAMGSDAAPINSKRVPLPKVSIPVSNPAGGVSFTASKLEIALTCDTEGATIFYTVGGSKPEEGMPGSVKYQDKIQISATATVKAVAVKDGMENSDILIATFTKESSGSGGGGSIGGGGGGGGSATMPSKPSTPTQPTTPTKPTTPEQNKPEKPAVNAAEQFTDVQAGAWYEQSVNYVLEKGLMQGTGEKTFAPGDTLSRAMLAQILYNNEGKPAAKGESKFSDVSGGWYAEAVAWAGESGVVTGNADGSFNPNGAITREQIAVILYRYAQQKGYDTGKKADLSAFADADSISDYAKEAMAWANAAGLINGMDETTLAPGGNATRAQVAAILMRFLQSVEK